MEPVNEGVQMKLLALLSILLAAVTAKADVPAVHGMLVFGNKATYASHLPMFHHPHDYQLVMKINLGSGVTVSRYEKLKAQGETLFTIAPKPMDLALVMNGSIKSFPAELFHGHFERGGTPLGPVTVAVETFIINTKLNPQAMETHEFLVFGAEGEYFAAHLIKGKPSFDFVAAVSKPYTLSIAHCERRACLDPEKIPVSDDKLPLTLQSVLGNALPKAGHFLFGSNRVATEIMDVIYVEKNELAH